MKNLTKIFAFLIAILTVTSLLFSCKRQDGAESEETTLPPVSDTSDVTTEKLEAPRTSIVDDNGKLKYTVIRYPAEPDDTTMEAVKKLRDRISSYTGTAPKLQAVYNSTVKPLSPDACEILVGELAYEESRTALSGIQFGDYRITVVGKKIVIAAYSADELARAISYVTGSMIGKKDEDGNRLLSVTEYEYLHKREITSVTLNGNDLSEYSIAYGTKGSGDDHNLAGAKMLREHISKKAGYLLPLIKDTDKCETKRRIFVGAGFNGVSIQTPSAMCYECRTVGDDYVIACGGNYTAEAAVFEFIVKHFNKPPTDGRVTISDYSDSFLKVKEAPRASGSEYRIMTYNILAHYWTDYICIDKRSEPFRAVIDVYSPDIVGLQEVCNEWSAKLPAILGEEYAFVNQKTPDGKFINLSTIIYKKDKFEVVESGLEYLTPQGPNHIRLVNWAIFKDKATGKQFAFFNTHWDPTSGPHGADHARILNKIMAEHPDVKHVFSTGDYNAKPGTEAYTTFLTQTGLVNSCDVAKAAGTLKNEAGGCSTVGFNREDTATGGPIDHVIITKNVGVLAFETILWNGIEHVSDHSPKYADVVLN